MKITDIFSGKETHKSIIKVGFALLLAMELFIYIGAVVHSGSESWLIVYDKNGDKIYESQGKIITRFEKRIFESAYGPLERYRIQTETRHTPFPFRAWLAIAVGAPIGLALLMIYLVRVYMTFLNGEEKTAREKVNGYTSETADFSSRWFGRHRFSIFHLGFFLVLCLLALWLIPDYIARAARGLMETALQFKWFFLAVCVFLASLVVWIIYLRYRMAQRMMDGNMELEKFRVEKESMLEMKKTEMSALPASTYEKVSTGGVKETHGNPKKNETEQNSRSEKKIDNDFAKT